VKQHLAALRKFFDYLVVKQVLTSNPAAAVRGPKHSVRKGKTPVLSNDEAAELLSSIDTSHVVGLRDRAIIGFMLYSWSRVGALVQMRVDDYYQSGRTWRLRLHEKNGKVIDLPAHHNLVEYLGTYLEAAGIADDKEGYLFRSAIGKTKRLTAKPLNTVDVLRMMKRRAKAAGLPERISPHSCRATGITNFIANGGRKDKAQEMAGHADARTTSLYDHSDNPITLDDVERINFGT
jgi:site-specific recombinase XerC